MSALIGGQNLTKTLIFSQIISGEYNGIVVPVQVLVCLANTLRGNFSGMRYFFHHMVEKDQRKSNLTHFSKNAQKCVKITKKRRNLKIVVQPAVTSEAVRSGSGSGDENIAKNFSRIF